MAPSLRTTFSLLAALSLATAAVAQVHAGEFTPNPALPGQLVTFTMTDSTGAGRTLPSPCGWYIVRRGSQTGPMIDLGVRNCPGVIVTVPPNGSYAFEWDQRAAGGQQVPNDVYWIEVRSEDAAQRVSRDWFCLSIQPANAPALRAVGPVAVGTVTPLQIAAPQHAGAFWFCALSLSANVPVQAFGLQTCLSAPFTGDAITGAFGQLDAQGGSAGMALPVPNVPALRFLGVQVQALLLGSTAPALTNGLALTIR